jgi:flagellar hook assembly protein FlgD
MQLDGRATLRLYNARGQHVRTLLDNERASGEFDLEWNGTDDAGRRVASGVYWCRLDYEGRSETEKLLLVR